MANVICVADLGSTTCSATSEVGGPLADLPNPLRTCKALASPITLLVIYWCCCCMQAQVPGALSVYERMFGPMAAEDSTPSDKGSSGLGTWAVVAIVVSCATLVLLLLTLGTDPCPCHCRYLHYVVWFV